ncbi:hypothetical protein MIB92_16210 [Aestuariirhabdus sp. Z084]|uniref:hypothetical protein n=1 Tax=Aestuariirhabdus haliotis TaxID=2918751 RepID=UPI00201B3892|nr:hypothetical protein [Aestuariirhabdus haliotis]MCL6417205.1 hypothetical protein [Aestuariirhabdus haliotis]MCL6421177.1 hypothetical protein [Aestuariirhabdus haliotis]
MFRELGFTIKYERPEEGFAYLILDGVDLRLEEVAGNNRKWMAGEPEIPLDCGVNLQ